MRALLNITCLIICTFVAAPCAAAQDAKAYEPWRWTHYGLESGLPSESVKQVVEAADGEPWVCTEDGFAYFDGFRWVPIGEEHGLPQGRELWIEPLADGRLAIVIDSIAFIGTRDGFERLTFPEEAEGFKAQRVVSSPERGSLIVRAFRNSDQQNKILKLWQGGCDEVELPFELPPNRAPQLWHGAKNELFINTVGGLVRWSLDGMELHIESPSTMNVIEVVGGSDGHGVADVQWPSERRGLWRWQPGSKPVRDLDGERARVESLGVAATGQLLVAYSSGDIRFRLGERWTDFPAPPLEFGTPDTFCFRTSGDLWMGTGDGVYLFRRMSQRWQNLVVGERDARDRVNEICPAKDGTIWLATDAGIAARRPDGSIEWTHEVDGHQLNIVTGLAIDGNGIIWASSGSAFPGAVRFDGETWSHIGLEEGLAAERVHKIRIDSRGRPWFLGMHYLLPHAHGSGPGAFVYENEQFTQWGPEQGLANGRVYDFDQGPDGSLWFATLGGISRWYAGEWEHWSAAQGLATTRTFAIEVDRQNRVWFGHQSAHGLGVLEPESGMTPRYIKTEDGLASNSVMSVAEDSRGWIWATTASGLSLVREGATSSFDAARGLLHDHLWPVYAEEDRILIGTLGRGVTILDLRTLDRTPPRLELSRPFVDGSTVHVEWTAFAHQGAVSGSALRTRYRLDDGPWGPWGTERRAEISELDRGDHEFEVQVAGLLGDVQTARNVHTFKVLPPLIQRPAFLLPVSVLSLSVLTLMWTLHVRRRKHVDDLRSNEERYRDLWENANDLNYTHDLDHNITALNTAAEYVFGFDPGTALGMPLEQLVSPESRSNLRRALKQTLAGREPRTYELEVHTQHGQRVPLEISTRLLESGGAVIGMQSVARDLTIRRELENQLRQSQKMEAVGQLAGGIAHDLNNVLVVINGYCDLMLQDGAADAESTEMVREIGLSGRRAASLTRQLLAFSRNQVLQPQPIDVCAIATEMQDMLNRLVGEEVSLQLEVSGEPAVVRADPGQIEQVILNLAINARDAMPLGGTLVVAVHAVEEDHEGVPHVALVVGDTGTGMGSKMQERIFDPFFTTKDQGEGPGLGLSTVYGIVQQSGGEITVDSEVGKGSRFTILLPALPVSELESSKREVTLELPAGSETILLVEDESSVRQFVHRVLGRHGYRVLDAADGQEAIREAERLGARIDMLLTDVVMPGMKGPDLAHRLCKMNPNLRVLFISGHVGEAFTSHEFSDDETHFLQKPFTPSDLLAKIQLVLNSPPGATHPLPGEV